jgi:quercetin dioxygenase-like cupin family protein
MTTTGTSEEIHDPVIGYWVSFERDGENLVINTRARPGGGPPPHVHPNGDERFTIQQGEVEFLVGRRKVVATRATSSSSRAEPGTRSRTSAQRRPSSGP